MPSKSFQYIKKLCDYDNDYPQSEMLEEELKLILELYPNVAYETDDRFMARGFTPLHHAAMNRSPEFCKLLIEMNPEAVRVTTSCFWGVLPIHISCVRNNVETAKYLFQLYPDSINIPASWNGQYAIHVTLEYVSHGENISELIRFLLKHDRRAVTIPDFFDFLPLHLAINENRGMDVVRLVFDAYPEAIYEDRHSIDGEETILQFARRLDRSEVVTFFESQLEFVRQSSEETASDENGQLSIHRGLYSRDLSLGTIKLMVKANPTIISAADNQGCIPLHISCQIGDFDIAKYLIESNVDSLEVYDMEGNCSLHHACLAGNCEIINCILEKSAHGSSLRNSEGKLPIQSLLYDADINRDSLEYVGAVYGLLSAYPNVQDIALEWMND